MKKIKSISKASTAEEVVDIIKKQYKKDITGETKDKLESNLRSFIKRKKIQVKVNYEEIYNNAYTLVYIEVNHVISYLNERDKRLNKSLFKNLQLPLILK